MHPGCPESVAGLDLNRHGLLEASAGTGKTYAIEHLVLRLLLENETWDLSRILVLTFTEKAAGELKEKIRARLAWRIAQGGLTPSALGRLKEAHLSFDRASIYTIHGFCQRVLRNYAFENNALFRMELVKKNREVLEKALIEEMRSTWLAEAGEGPEGLAAFRSMATALNLGARSKWDDKLLHVAGSYNPARGDALLPEFDPMQVAGSEDSMLAAVEALRNLFPGLVEGSEPAHPFAVRYRTIRFENPTLKKKAPLLVESILALAAACAPTRSREHRLERCESFLEALNLNVAKQDFACLMPAPAECATLPWPELEEMIRRLDAIRAGSRSKKKLLAARAFVDQRRVIIGLRQRAQDFKRTHGLIGFDDMIEGVHAALRDRPGLERALRQEYRCCLVDEFQDTDPLQWDIFKRIFLDAGSTHPLFLIGDPKQAIYRFRGGDIHTYMDARRVLQDLSFKGRAQGLSLNTNFRSSKEMVAACNAVFAHPRWFHALAVDPGADAWKLPADPDPLGYLPARHGGLDIQACADTTGRPAPIVLRDFSADLEKASVEKKVTAWIVAEIAALMSAPESLRIPDKSTRSSNKLRPLAFGDICVLVKKNREKARLEKALFRAGIPFQVDKRAGLYDSDAAGHYLALLESLEDPRDAGKQALALMTRFFRAAGDRLPQGPPSETHPWFDEWSRLADRRQWQRLFHSLLYRTGLLDRESLEEDGDRRIMDFLHIAQNLVLESLAKGYSLPALVQRLRDLRADSGGDDEEDLHREESEGGKVVLMTMHGSKGLEFPVVFVAAFSGPPRQSVLKYREGDRTVFNLDANDPEAKAIYKEESEGEERRLFYVAFTRARYKLYVPVLPFKYAKSQSGPLGDFAGEALRTAALAHPALFHEVEEDPVSAGPASAIPASGNLSATLSASAPASAPAAAASDAAPPDQSLAADPGSPDGNSFFSDAPTGDPFGGADAAFSARRRRLNSYSHLVKRGAGVSAEALEGRYEKDEVPVGIPGQEEDLPPAGEAPGNALPRGRETGNMFHEILEDMDFAVAASAADPETLLAHRPTADIIAARMLEHRLEETHRGDVAKVLWHTLRAELPDSGAPGRTFRLGDASQRRHEMEFLFPYPAGREGSGYLWGYIDLVFRMEGRYYLLDWKSNWLEEYGTASLEGSIRESRYDLQYMLYSMALDRWLASVLPGYDFDRHFGGIYYVYLRGMRVEPHAIHPAQAAVPGIFAFKPSLEEVRTVYPAHLDRALGRASPDGPAAQAAALAASGILDSKASRDPVSQGGRP